MGASGAGVDRGEASIGCHNHEKWHSLARNLPSESTGLFRGYLSILSNETPEIEIRYGDLVAAVSVEQLLIGLAVFASKVLNLHGVYGEKMAAPSPFVSASLPWPVTYACGCGTIRM